MTIEQDPVGPDRPTAVIPAVKPDAIPLISPAAPNAAPEEEASFPLEGSDAEAYAALKARRAERRKKKLVRRGIAAGVVAGVLAVGAIAVALLSPKPEESAGVVTDFALRGEYSTTIDASGTLEAVSSTVIAPETSGTIAEVRVVAGQAVNKGDVLMIIKNDELDRTVSEAERALKTAKAALVAAKRGETVVDPDTGQETTVHSQDAVDAAAYDTAVAAAGQRTVTSPITGNVITMNAKVGAPVATAQDNGQPLMQVADLSQMKVTIQVGEEDIANVAVDQQASITFPAFEDLVLSGKVTSIASTATGDGAVGAYGSEGSVQFAVDILIEATDPRLKPGMTASVQITIERLDDVVMVPSIALMSDDGENYYVVVETDPETGAHERVDVQVVAQNDDFAVVGRPDDEDAGSNPDMPASPLTGEETLVISGAELGDGDMSADAGVDMDMAV